MPGKLLRDISASTIQVVVNQLLGAIAFFLISIYLPKESFGELNWSLAIFIFANTFLSFRLEQIVVKRSATEKDSSKIMTLYLMHVLFAGVGFYLLLLLLKVVAPTFFSVHNLLLIVGISQLFNLISSPFKQVANGKERFDYLAIMSAISNLVRVILLVITITFFVLDIRWVLAIFISSSFIELTLSFFIVSYRMKIPISHSVGIRDYFALLKESLPQMGSAILMAGISRIDWILLGIFSTSAIMAEYSFAYRVYELSPLPMLIVAPVLLSRFSKYLAVDSGQSLLLKKKELSVFIRMEMIAATLIPLILNIIWAPVMDFLTGNKYGSTNQYIFLILSFCIPFQYINNIIWSAHFAKNRLKLIFKITTITFCVVVAGDLLFIPQYGARAAALVFLAAMITEYLNYMRSSELSKIKATWRSLIVCMGAAVFSGYATIRFLDNSCWRLALALPLFILLLLATGQIRKNDINFVRQLIRKT